MLSTDDLMAGLDPPGDGYRSDDPTVDGFGRQVEFAGQLLRSRPDIRVLHLNPENLFVLIDSHGEHRASHARAMEVVLPPLARLRRELETAGIADEVLIATTSEFGRRVAENGGGLDHGGASTMMLLGPVPPGIHGEPSSLRELDDAGNQIATCEFSDYYATLSAWMGVEPEEILDGRPRPIASLLGAP